MAVEAVASGGSQDISRGDILHLDEVASAIEGMATLAHNAFTKVAPTSAKLEFGVDVKAEAGKLTALLVNGSATASMKITLQWDKDH